MHNTKVNQSKFQNLKKPHYTIQIYAIVWEMPNKVYKYAAISMNTMPYI